jgi:hypothetical protein
MINTAIFNNQSIMLKISWKVTGSIPNEVTGFFN